MAQIKIKSIEQIKQDKNYVESNSLKNIDAKGIDLTDFPSESIKEIKNCNLENTGLKIFLTCEDDNELDPEIKIIDSNIIGAKFVHSEKKQNDPIEKIWIYLNNVILDKAQIQYLNSLYKNDDFQIRYDLKTILNNDGLMFDSIKLLWLLKNMIPNSKIFKEKDLHDIVETIDKIILKDTVGDLKTIYDNISNQL